MIDQAGMARFTFGSAHFTFLYAVNRYALYHLESLGGCDRWVRALVIGIERWQVTNEVMRVKLFVDPKENSFMPDGMADGYCWVSREEDRLRPLEVL